MHKSLSSAFSTKSLLEQEDIVNEVIDKFIEKIGIFGDSSNGIDMTKWYQMAVFDIFGEMAFGESFGSLEMGRLIERLAILFPNYPFV